MTTTGPLPEAHPEGLAVLVAPEVWPAVGALLGDLGYRVAPAPPPAWDTVAYTLSPPRASAAAPAPDRSPTVADMARVCHEALRAIQHLARDPYPSPPWDLAPEHQRQAAQAGVARALKGTTPQESHDTWCEQQRAAGWTHGPTEDPTGKTHPCLVPYAELPPWDQLKDRVFVAIVEAMTR